MNHLLSFSTQPILPASGGILHWAHLSFSLAALFLLLLAIYILIAGNEKLKWMENWLHLEQRTSSLKNAWERRSLMLNWPLPLYFKSLISRTRRTRRDKNECGACVFFIPPDQCLNPERNGETRSGSWCPGFNPIHVTGRSHGFAVWSPFLIVIFVTILVALAFSHQREFPIETHYNVSVWEQVAPNEWIVSSNEPEPHRLEKGRWKCCPDFPCATVIWPGYIAPMLKYEARGTCNSIRADGLGFFWQAEGKNDWINLKGEEVQ